MVNGGRAVGVDMIDWWLVSTLSLRQKLDQTVALGTGNSLIYVIIAYGSHNYDNPPTGHWSWLLAAQAPGSRSGLWSVLWYGACFLSRSVKWKRRGRCL